MHLRRNKIYVSGLYIKKTLNRLDLGIYWFWAGLRIFLTIIPQTGYIHPDEYFQSVEVFAGDVFGVEVSKPWEFNTTNPIRSIPVIYIATRIPLSILKTISNFLEMYTGLTLLSTYMVLVVPRLTVCLLSFITDYCLYKICYLYGQNYKERLIMYASSFIMLVFMTRTFTNSMEMICFSILLYLVASCMAESEKITYQNNYLKDRYEEAESIGDKVRISKLLKLLPKHSLRRCMPIAIVTVSGFFNRPTFIVYALAPLFYWFQRGLPTRPTFLKDFHSRIFIFILYCCPVVFFHIYADSIYYGYITWGEIINYKINFNNFVVCPLNFLRYNINSSNVAKHGLHPRFLHILINIPLLFNVLGIAGLLVIMKLLYRSSQSYWTLLPKSQSITGMMTLSFITPIVSLSAIPHQEPRFIIPVLIPLVFLYSHLIRDFEEHCTTVMPFRKRYPKPRKTTGIFKYPLKCISYFEKVTQNIDNRYNINGRYLTKLKNRDIVRMDENLRNGRKPEPEEDDDDDEKKNKKTTKRNHLIKLWYLFNFVCIMFFGFIHQGGIYGLAKDFRERLDLKPRYTTYHLVTSHIYSFPFHLLMTKPSYKFKNTNLVSYELGTENFENINSKLLSILKVSEAKKKSQHRNHKIFYALPTSLFNEFRYSYHYYSSNYSYSILNIFYPHFSSEALPNFTLNVTDSDEFSFCSYYKIFDFIDYVPVRYLIELLHQFGLILIQITSQN